MLLKRPTLLLMLAAGAVVAGCGDIRDAAGVRKTAPDEFAVVRRAPLSVPPSYDLRPPRPGERAVPQIDPRTQSQVAVFGVADQGLARATAGSAGEETLLRTLKIDTVDPSIRQKVDRESAVLALDERNFIERLMFWRDPPPPGTAVDAPAERARLQENDALGRPPTEGGTPSIERKETVRNKIF